MKSIHNKRYKDIIRFIRERRIAAGITQKEMAKKIHLRQNVISKIETCERRLDLLELLSYCKAVGLPLHEVTDYISIKTTKKNEPCKLILGHWRSGTGGLPHRMEELFSLRDTGVPQESAQLLVPKLRKL